MDEYQSTLKHTLGVLRKQERQLLDRVERLRRMAQSIQQELLDIEPASSPASGFTVGRVRTAMAEPVPGADSKPTATDQILSWVRENPGADSSLAADALVKLLDTDSDDPRKVVLTRIGQMVKAGRLHREGPTGKLYAVRNGHGG